MVETYYPRMGRGISLLAGGIWGLVRFVLTFLASVLFVTSSGTAHLFQIWAAAPALVLTGLFFASAYYPERYRTYLPVMRLGAGLALVSSLIVAAGRAFRWLTLPGEEFLASPVLRAALLVTAATDLVVFAALIASRPQAEDESPEPAARTDLPDYETTELKDTSAD